MSPRIAYFRNSIPLPKSAEFMSTPADPDTRPKLVLFPFVPGHTRIAGPRELSFFCHLLIKKRYNVRLQGN
jgi:hypothetical protein